jgi:hypothetical protein
MVERILALAVVITVGAAVVAFLLLLLRLVKPTVLRVFLALVAGLATQWVFGASLHIGKNALWSSETPPKVSVYIFDWLEWVYRDVCGMTTFIARLFGPGYLPGADLILPENEAAYAVAGYFRIIVWTALFATAYFLLRRRTSQRSNQTMQRTAGSLDS